MARFRVLYTDRGDYSHDFALEQPYYDAIGAEAAPKLKVAVRSGVGYENFDLAAFAERGIPACNVPDYGSEEVAVHALSLVLALRRRVVFFDKALREGYWRGWPAA